MQQPTELSNTPISIYALVYGALYCFPVCCGHNGSIYGLVCCLC